MSNVILVGARAIREDVVKPGRIVDWIFTDVRGGTVIYGDALSIFIFDLQMRVLHKLIGESYGRSEITKIRYHKQEVIARVHLDVARDVQAGLQNTHPPQDTLLRLIQLAWIHPPTQERLRAWLEPAN